MKPRAASVDLLRGIVMVLMALDHTRDFFGPHGDPTDLATTTAPLFFTRFVTHYCAPVFVFLAGTGAFLSRAAGKPAGALARFLWTRGVWLVVLELTIVRFGWSFDLTYRVAVFQVIWAIGISMIALSFLVRLPLAATAATGAVMVLGHDALDGVHADALGAWGPLWSIVHEMHGWEPVAGHRLFVAYPLVPWIGVMALGYAFGAWMTRPRDARRRVVLRAGLAATIAFVLLRTLNVYADPQPWSTQKSALFTALSFLDVSKYPPSLDYLLVTLGPSLVFLALAEDAKGPLARALTVFGRVPLFYYVAHIYVIHAVAQAVRLATHTPSGGHFFGEGLGWPLPAVYGVWLAVVLALYPACCWYAQKKTGETNERVRMVLSYL